MKKQGLLPLFSLLGLCLSGCATTYRVQTYPADAKVTVKNPVSQEVFELGSGTVDFVPKPEYGPSFIVTASKKGYKDREIYISPQPGSATDYLVTLKTSPAERSIASLDDLDSTIKKRVEALMKEAEDNIRKAEEDRRQAMVERVRAELAKKDVVTQEKIGTLERSFDVYKDALFSERYASGPASFDRHKVDMTVDYVNRVQQMIDAKRYAEADTLVDRMLEKDEYFAKGYALKGTVKYLQNKTGEAITAWERAVTLDPNDKASQIQLAQLYQQTGRTPASLTSSVIPDAAPPAPAKAPASLKVRNN